MPVSTSTGGETNDVDPALEQRVVERRQIRDDEAEVRRADVARLDIRPVAGRREILEELDHVLAPGNAEMRHADVRIWVADDLSEIATLLLLRGKHLAPEQVPVEGDRSVEVGHRVAGVVEASSSHCLHRPPPPAAPRRLPE